MSTHRILSSTALCVLLLAGCAYGELHQVLRAQVSSELNCPTIEVKKKGLSYLGDEEEDNKYLVSGCGVTRTYTCPDDTGLKSYDEPACTGFVEGDSDAPELAQEVAPGFEDPFEEGEDTAGGEDTDAEAEAPAKKAAKPAKPAKGEAKPAKGEAKPEADEPADDE